MNIIEFIMDLDWKKIVESILSALLASGIIGSFGYLITKKITRDLRIAKEMKSYGFKGVVAMKNHTTREIMDLCENADKLDLFVISGIGFFSNNEYILKSAMDRGMRIRLLCSQVETPFLSDLEQLEIENQLRKPGTKISDEIRTVVKKYESYIQENKMEIGFYSSEYRLPFMLVYKNGEDGKITKAWLRVTLPPYNWVTNFALVGERKYTAEDNFFENENGQVDFISMMEAHFECVWKVADREIDREQEIKNTNFEVKS
ncbi:hypothetical protein [Streptococcus sp.]